MTTTRKTAQSQFKARGGDRGDPREKTLSQLGRSFKVHPSRLQSGGRRPWSRCRNSSWMATR